MPKSEEWSFSETMQPSADAVAFDLAAVLDAVVLIRAEVPDDAFTAQTLGTERTGNGVVISADGVILTIGYLVTEAETVWITTNHGKVLRGVPLAYDQQTGFGLVRAIGELGLPVLTRADPSRARTGDRVYLVGQGGIKHALKAYLVAKREFAGYWEYLLEQSLVVAPAHPHWSGAALVNEAGQLLGVGSLLMQEQVDGKSVQTNMVVPIDLLEPILPSLLETGQSGLPARPWLGLFAGDAEEQVVVAGVVDDGPAEKAGIEEGDLIIEVAGRRVSSLAAFLRAVWALGPAGVKVPLLLARDGDLLRTQVDSVDRNDLLRRSSLH
ncbi:MAG: S1C family serine protease [Burkholderiaceae bacterium]